MKNPLISVIIPCYNQGMYLEAAIESVLRQGYPNLEILVVNDGSSDETKDVARTFSSSIVYIEKTNFGRSAARNTGILASRGEYVIFMDADDLVDDEMLKTMARAANEFPQTDVFVGGWQDLVDEKLGEAVNSIPLPADTFHGILARNIGVIHCFMVRREILANSGLFDITLSAAEDWDLWIRLAAAGASFRSVPNAIAIYRRHGNNSTANYEHVMKSTKLMLKKNSKIHTNCAFCQEAARDGWKSHFEIYVLSRGFEEIKMLAFEKKRLALIAHTISLTFRYPPFFTHLLRAWFHRQKCI